MHERGGVPQLDKYLYNLPPAAYHLQPSAHQPQSTHNPAGDWEIQCPKVALQLVCQSEKFEPKKDNKSGKFGAKCEK